MIDGDDGYAELWLSELWQPVPEYHQRQETPELAERRRRLLAEGPEHRVRARSDPPGRA
jgi:hypothetical protein